MFERYKWLFDGGLFMMFLMVAVLIFFSGIFVGHSTGTNAMKIKAVTKNYGQYIVENNTLVFKWKDELQ